MAAVSERSDSVIGKKGEIARSKPGGGENKYELTLNADGLEKDYKYDVTVDAEQLTDEESQNCIYKAEDEIDETFFSKGESAEKVTSDVNMKEQYVNGLVTAEWILSDYETVSVDGEIISDGLKKSGNLVTAEVTLSCGDQKIVYTFSFVVFPKELSQQEKFVKDVDTAIKKEMSKKGVSDVVLPKEVNGIKLNWSETKENLVIKVIFFEIAVCFLLYYARKEKEKQTIKARQDSMRLDYAEVVSKLAILLGAGMSIKQAWNRISAQNSNKRSKQKIKRRPVYEEMLVTSHEIQDGVSERIAYQRFGERTGVNEYHRLSRLLVQNMQKGNRSICSILEEEAENAYEQRRLLAKKIGEEAGTKMLIPLMLMMVIVIAIVAVPAVLSF